MADRTRCRHTIDSLGNDNRRGKGNRPWWRRQCKRWAVSGGVYCWQHGGNGPDTAVASMPLLSPTAPTREPQGEVE